MVSDANCSYWLIYASSHNSWRKPTRDSARQWTLMRHCCSILIEREAGSQSVRERGRRSRLKSKDRWDELKKMTFAINRATSFIFPLSLVRALLSVQRSFPVLLTTFSRPCCLSVPAESLLSIYSCSRLHASLVRSCFYIDTHTPTIRSRSSGRILCNCRSSIERYKQHDDDDDERRRRRKIDPKERRFFVGGNISSRFKTKTECIEWDFHGRWQKKERER